MFKRLLAKLFRRNPKTNEFDLVLINLNSHSLLSRCFPLNELERIVQDLNRRKAVLGCFPPPPSPRRESESDRELNSRWLSVELKTAAIALRDFRIKNHQLIATVTTLANERGDEVFRLHQENRLLVAPRMLGVILRRHIVDDRRVNSIENLIIVTFDVDCVKESDTD